MVLGEPSATPEQAANRLAQKGVGVAPVRQLGASRATPRQPQRDNAAPPKRWGGARHQGNAVVRRTQKLSHSSRSSFEAAGLATRLVGAAGDPACAAAVVVAAEAAMAGLGLTGAPSGKGR